MKNTATVRATSLLCLLGIGLGLGSVLLYKLCSRVLSPAITAVRGKKRPTSPGHGQFPPHTKGALSPETPDSGISTGTTLTQTVSSTVVTPDGPLPETTFSIRYHSRSRPSYHAELDQLDELADPRYKRRSGTFVSSTMSDQGFESGHFSSRDRLSRYYSDHDSIGHHSMPAEMYQSHSSGGSYQPMSYSAERLRGNFSPFPGERLPLVDESSYANSNFQGAFRGTSTPQSHHPSLRRNQYSHASDLSASTDYSMMESVCSESDRMSYLQTPSDMFEGSTPNMDQLHQDIRIIRDEITEMNDRVQVLSSRENLLQRQEMMMLTPNPLPGELCIRNRRRPKQRHNSGGSCNTAADNEADPTTWRRSYHHADEFMWDYQSDLAVDDSINFIAQRPNMDESAAKMGDDIDYDSPTFDHVRKYIESCCNANITDNAPGSESQTKKSRTFNSITDMYIDDSLSEYDTGEQRNVPDGCYSNANTTGENIEHQVVQKELSFSQNLDCDNNGNEEIPSSVGPRACTVNPQHKTCNEHSVCLDCGSPSHRRRCREVINEERLSVSSGSKRGESDGSINTREISSHNSSKTSVESCPNCGHTSETDFQTTLLRNKLKRWQVMNICDKVNIFEFAERHVKMDQDAQIVKKGYHQIPRLLGMSEIRPIRSDNYCVLRGVLYQICVNNYNIMSHIGNFADVQKRMTVFDDPFYAFLKNWNFANRLPYDSDSVMDRITDCLHCFYTQMEHLSKLPSSAAREMALMELLNFDPEVDLKLMEAIKFLMMLEAIDMHEMYTGRAHHLTKPPVFVWLMYSRQSSQSPEALFYNHINPLGDTHGAQQVELFLLGYTLGVKIEVVRPPRYGHDDFISHYPDDGADNFPNVYLVAEDEQHYHAIMA